MKIRTFVANSYETGEMDAKINKLINQDNIVINKIFNQSVYNKEYHTVKIINTIYYEEAK